MRNPSIHITLCFKKCSSYWEFMLFYVHFTTHSKTLMVIFLQTSHSESWSHLHLLSQEEPHQVSAGGRLLLCGYKMHWCSHHTMDVHVRSCEPHHRDMAAWCIHQHHNWLQQQSTTLQQWFYGPAGPAATGCWILCGHCDRNDRK